MLATKSTFKLYFVFLSITCCRIAFKKFLKRNNLSKMKLLKET